MFWRFHICSGINIEGHRKKPNKALKIIVKDTNLREQNSITGCTTCKNIQMISK